MKNTIIYDFFNNLEVNKLKNEIESNMDKIQIQNFLGRSRLDFQGSEVHDFLPKYIIKKVESLTTNLNKNYELRYVSFVEYNNEYGIPNLGPHKDAAPFTFSLLYQMESNTEWDLYVEGKTFSLIDNSGLIMNVRDQDHWRNKKIFKDGEFIKMVFFHFLDLEDIENNVVTPEQLAEINEKWKNVYVHNDNVL
jgi:hypothetical protein